ncbi:MAG: hypothetical protein CSA81_11305 [Acidobacteria bacterium]|nr:MAG: hypothetical protein CSA81_11305 [Acidobacteriota bacterium]PIE89962.1 MAG: hypothetical protein CR997_08265 [Acidobacteriota bacterium]
MDSERQARYEKLKDETRAEIDLIDQEVEVELNKIKKKIAELQQAKEAQLSIYGGYCSLLGVPNDLEEDEEFEEELEE